MPNQRAAGIVNVSFSMPQSMADTLESRARIEMTNRSEIVRRAVMAYLSPSERARIQQSLLEAGSSKVAETGGGYKTAKKGKTP